MIRKQTIGVGGKINGYRRAIGKTVGAFAKLCRTPESTMEAICIEGREPASKTLWKICHYSGFHIDAIDERDWGAGNGL